MKLPCLSDNSSKRKVLNARLQAVENQENQLLEYFDV